MNRMLLVLLVIFLPLLAPPGPGNTAPVDVVAVAYLFAATIFIIRRRGRFLLPAPVGFALIVGASIVALMFSEAVGVGLLNFVIDLYVLLLFVVIANDLRDDERAFRTVLGAWVVGALGWSALLIALKFQVAPHALEKLLGVSTGSRAFGATNNNPNLAGSYMAISLFVLWASSWPRRFVARFAAGVVIALGLYSTGSNGGLLTVIVGVAFLAFAAYLRHARAAGQVKPAVGAAVIAVSLLLIATVLVGGIPRISLNDVATVAQEQKGGVFANSLGRLSKTITGRIILWGNAWQRGGAKIIIGVGPGEAKDVVGAVGLAAASGARQKSLHNDYLAFVIERGIVGLVGLLLLYGYLFRRCWQLARVPGPARLTHRALGGAVAGNAFFSFFHESFHFRHILVLFALVVVAAELSERSQRLSLPDAVPVGALHAVR